MDEVGEVIACHRNVGGFWPEPLSGRRGFRIALTSTPTSFRRAEIFSVRLGCRRSVDTVDTGMSNPRKRFDFAADITKQLITLAAAIITLTVTFSKDIPEAARPWAFWAWCVFTASILFGCADVVEGRTASETCGRHSCCRKRGAVDLEQEYLEVCLLQIFQRVAMRSVETPAEAPL